MKPRLEDQELQGLWIASYVALWIMVVVEGVVLMAVLRQVGLLHLRVGPAAARTMNLGPEIGSRLPELNIADASGLPLDVTFLGRPHMIIFVSSTCDACADLMPAVRTLVKSEGDRVAVILVAVDHSDEHAEAFSALQGLHEVKFINDPRAPIELGVMSAPYAILADRDGVVRAKGLVNHIEHLDSLMHALAVGHPTMESYLRFERQKGGVDAG
jgi:methylamine dehydrogenase accessory protein MauD